MSNFSAGPWPFFTTAEMACRHCSVCKMDDLFMERLVALRRELNFPLIINSGYRCPEYNNRVSSTGFHGPHTTGRAVDIKVSSKQAAILVSGAYKNFFTGLGVRQHGPYSGRFIHLDDLIMPGHPRPRIWSYP